MVCDYYYIYSTYKFMYHYHTYDNETNPIQKPKPNVSTLGFTAAAPGNVEALLISITES